MSDTVAVGLTSTRRPKRQIKIDQDNARKVQQALNKACGVTAAMSCYVKDGWSWSPEEMAADLEQILAIVRDTKRDGQSPWDHQ